METLCEHFYRAYPEFPKPTSIIRENNQVMNELKKKRQFFRLNYFTPVINSGPFIACYEVLVLLIV